MNLSDFKNSIQMDTPPSGLSVYLQSLWLDKKGDWDRAHGLIDSLGGEDAASLHAYLHRKEGDLSNAGYWYRRAGKNPASNSLEEEWEQLVTYFLKK
ncbi:hypothetical protein [Cyclobacterium jeungdonense]|uniref:Sel1 repeat family protein n=1 Tax=Cyclobacterium jeungdonense TaxID=708087 RepID=A0ABT8CF50_9BACT|nr:hypothetical protein [Cyclobacterium jeungdonense]MDN3690569.1 hypothetical protein [Cyclobacterium jeungdonense]